MFLSSPVSYQTLRLGMSGTMIVITVEHCLVLKKVQLPSGNAMVSTMEFPLIVIPIPRCHNCLGRGVRTIQYEYIKNNLFVHGTSLGSELVAAWCTLNFHRIAIELILLNLQPKYMFGLASYNVVLVSS